MHAASSVSWRFWIVISLAAVSGLVFASGGRASAPHLTLSKSEPMADSTVVAPPKEIKLWFSEPVHLAMTSVQLVGQDSAVVPLEKLAQDKATGAPVQVPVKGAVKPGLYYVRWKTMGNDGHAVSGEYKFTVETSK